MSRENPWSRWPHGRDEMCAYLVPVFYLFDVSGSSRTVPNMYIEAYISLSRIQDRHALPTLYPRLLEDYLERGL